MQTHSQTRPVTAAALVAARLEAMQVFAPATGESESALWARGGAAFSRTAADIVAALSADRRLTREAKRKAGSEALVFARLADMCMERCVATVHAGPAGKPT